MFTHRQPVRQSSVRVALRTNDIARLLDVTPSNLRQMIKRGQIVFTGDSVKDFLMLQDLLESRKSR